MSRPLKIPREEAIHTAMYVFWAKGYMATTIDDLQTAMGLQRGSFYFHFKDKRTLFIEVLDHYRKVIIEKRGGLVRAEPSPKAGIHLYFQLLLDHLIENKSESGCLNTNSATELGLSDEEISRKLGLSMEDWKNFWVEILIDTQNKKEISKDLDVIATAHLLVALTQGLNVVARVNASSEFLKGIIKAGLSVLDN